MQNLPSKIKKINQRIVASLAVTVMLLAMSAGVIPSPQAGASTAQVATRSIMISSSTVSATGVAYKVGFTPTTTGAQSLVIDFCSNSAIISGSCTAPSGMTTAGVALTAGAGTANWTISSTASNTVKLTKNTGSPFTTSPIDFTLTNITNPDGTPSSTFYARVYTYSDTAYGGGTPYTSPTVIGNNIDYGGFALSTNSVLNISATIMESLTFCVSKPPAPGNGCTSLTAPNLILGHGSPQILDATAVDTDTAYTQVSTNALTGAVVNMKTNNSCTGLSRDSGATCPIPGKGAFGAVSTGIAFFGLNVANGTGGTGTVTANGNYGTTASNYGMGASVAGAGVFYGDPIEASTAAVSNVNSLLTFAATASPTTPAGVYSVSEQLIATGTY